MQNAVHGSLSVSTMVSMVIAHNHILLCVHFECPLTNYYLLYAMYIAKGDKHIYSKISQVSFNLLFALKKRYTEMRQSF